MRKNNTQTLKQIFTLQRIWLPDRPYSQYSFPLEWNRRTGIGSDRSDIYSHESVWRVYVAVVATTQQNTTETLCRIATKDANTPASVSQWRQRLRAVKCQMLSYHSAARKQRAWTAPLTDR